MDDGKRAARHRDEHQSKPSTVYAGTAHGGYVHRSLDAGATWQRYRVANANGAVNHIASAGGGVVYAGTAYNGVFRSADAGATWARRTERIRGGDIRALVTVPSSPRTVYVGTQGDGIHRSTDNGRTWVRRGLAGRTVTDLAVHRARQGTVYAATDRGVYKTTDHGRRWRLSPRGSAAPWRWLLRPRNPRWSTR